MDYLIDFITNRIFVSTAASWFIAQFTKILIEWIKGGFRPERIAGGGGFPSAHSATVTGLACSTGIVCGTGGFEFVMALIFAIVVMYDAMGVRYETGQQAKVLNRMREKELSEGREPEQDQPMEEKIGHTFPEIAAGVILGIFVAVIVCYLMR